MCVCQRVSCLMFNTVLNKDPFQDEFVSPAFCSSLAGASTSNHLSLQLSDPQLRFVHHTSSSLFSTLIACERCPLWFRLHAKVLSGRVWKSAMCVCSEDEGAANAPTEDKPVSPQDMTHLSLPQRISALTVNIIAKGVRVCWLCFSSETLRSVCAFSFLKPTNVTLMYEYCQVRLVWTQSLLSLVKNSN